MANMSRDPQSVSQTQLARSCTALSISWLLLSSVTDNSTSLGCGQNRTFEDVTGQHFLDQTTKGLMVKMMDNGSSPVTECGSDELSVMILCLCRENKEQHSQLVRSGGAKLSFMKTLLGLATFR